MRFLGRPIYAPDWWRRSLLRLSWKSVSPRRSDDTTKSKPKESKGRLQTLGDLETIREWALLELAAQSVLTGDPRNEDAKHALELAQRRAKENPEREN